MGRDNSKRGAPAVVRPFFVLMVDRPILGSSPRMTAGGARNLYPIRTPVMEIEPPVISSLKKLTGSPGFCCAAT